MSDRMQYVVVEMGGAFVYSLIFGGFFILPIFASWFYFLWKTSNISCFRLAWISLCLVSILLFWNFVEVVLSVNDNYGKKFEGVGGGPISPFPNIPDFPKIIFPMMFMFSSLISPFLLISSLLSWRRFKRAFN